MEFWVRPKALLAVQLKTGFYPGVLDSRSYFGGLGETSLSQVFSIAVERVLASILFCLLLFRLTPVPPETLNP